MIQQGRVFLEKKNPLEKGKFIFLLLCYFFYGSDFLSKAHAMDVNLTRSNSTLTSIKGLVEVDPSVHDSSSDSDHTALINSLQSLTHQMISAQINDIKSSQPLNEDLQVLQAEIRKNYLETALKSDHPSVQNLLIPQGFRNRMPLAVQEHVEEEHPAVEGVFEAYGAYKPKTSKSYYHFLHTDDGTRYPLYVPKHEGKQTTPEVGSRIRIHQSYSIPTLSEGKALLPVAHQETKEWMTVLAVPRVVNVAQPVRKTLVYLLNFQDKPTNQPWPVSEHPYIFLIILNLKLLITQVL